MLERKRMVVLTMREVANSHETHNDEKPLLVLEMQSIVL